MIDMYMSPRQEAVSMMINNNVQPGVGAHRSEQAQHQGNAPAAGSGSAGSGNDLVNLSNATSLIARSAGMTSPERQAKIQSLTDQVRSGQYQTDPAALTQALVSSMFA
jgi:anti-sigma28 factor (negative regulator of flagellin synthesis)